MTTLITGSGSGLGLALCSALRNVQHSVLKFDHKDGHDVRDPAKTFGPTCPDDVDVLINCAGVNKTEWLENVTDQDWDDVMDTNAKGIFKMTQWALPALISNRGTVVNIVSNAAHVPMTCSAAYNASKGAAHILTLQLARELTKKHGITVFGVAPNKMAGTGMSRDIEEQVVKQRGWTKEQAAAYQLAALLPGEETPPKAVAEFIAFLLSERYRHKFLSGCILPYGA
jgi:NAD(P)-dependent dehydrogenase (short-subunit alcohol dehydrogenase family)